MPRLEQAIVAFNRGLVSRLALARVDLRRMQFSCETMVNWMPRSLGSMMLRPGLQYIDSILDNAPPRCLPFVFATDDTAIIEFTDEAFRVWIDDEILTRESVASMVNNGEFTASLTGWTDNDEVGGTSAWVAGSYMGLTGNGTAAAIRDQAVTVAAADQGVEHALHIIVERGPVILRVGSTTGGDEYISETELATGAHSLAFTPTGTPFNIRFLSRLKRIVLVNSCQVEAAGAMVVESPYLEADLGNIRYDQSGDVVFLACVDYQQQRIERRAARSWSIVRYYANDGPFRTENIGPITMAVGALSGNPTLTASAAYFKPGHVGALFRVTTQGQNVIESITAQNTFTDAIRVVGVDAARVFTVILSGLSGTGTTATLQRSFDSDTGPFSDVQNYTADTTVLFDDTLDNQVVWYRLGVKTGNYSSGTISAQLAYSQGSVDGIARVTGYTSATVVSVEVLQEFGSITASDVWAEGKWSDYRGWPSAVALYEGRLGWAGKDGVQLSVSDAFDSFDQDFEGDAGPIVRSIGSGPVDTISWMLPLLRLILGGQGGEHSCRSNSFDEPLTLANFNIKTPTNQGSAGVSPAKVDSRGMFVQRGGTRLFEAAFNTDTYDYEAVDLTLLIPEIGLPGISRIAVQRQPDTRVHCVRTDGTAAVLVTDKAENVLCWLEIESPGADGLIEDVVILPGAAGSPEDRVYYVVNRTINGETVRNMEKWALESECVGGNISKLADSFIVVTNDPPSKRVLGLGHLEGQQGVVVWADGVDVGTDSNNEQIYSVDGGELVSTGGLSYLDLPGVAGSNASTPDASAIDITGDIDIRARVQLNDWTPSGSPQNIVGKWNQLVLGISNSSYRFTVDTGGFLRLVTSATGGSPTVSGVSTLPVPADDGTAIWVRATMDVDNGAGGNTVTFYTSTDGTTWDQLGAQVVNAGTTSIFNSTSSLFIGSGGNDRILLAGRVFSVQIYNGIDGTLAASFDPRDGTTGATSMVSSETGETYTIGSAAQLVNEAGLVTEAENVVVGLAYTAPWKSAKLGQSLAARMRIDHLGLVLQDTHPQGLRYGRDFENLDPLPMVVEGAIVDPDVMFTTERDEITAFPGSWDMNSRVCLEAAAPRPVTVLAAVARGEGYA